MNTHRTQRSEESEQNLRSPRRNHRRSKQVARSFLSGGSASFRLKFSRCCLYGGIDLHANNSVVVLLNEQDQVIYQKRLPNHLPTILEPLSRHHREIEGVVVESTYNWYWLVDGLLEAGYRVHLANPAAMQQYSGLKYTDDHSDARWLAHLLRLGV
jgi:hypothetical protein